MPEGEGEAWNSSRKEIESRSFSLQLKLKKPSYSVASNTYIFYYSIEQLKIKVTDKKDFKEIIVI